MISAREARERAEKATQNGIQKEIEKIEPEIEKAILQGKNHVTLGGSLSKPTGDYLRSLGYEVEHGSQYNESYFTVKW